MQYSINLTFHVIKTLVLYLFLMSSVVKRRPLNIISNQTVHMWIFVFLISSCFCKVLWYHVPFHVSWKFWNNKYPHLMKGYSVLDFKEQWHSISERVSLIKLCIEQNILLILFMSKIRIILYCNVLKVFSFKLLSSF